MKIPKTMRVHFSLVRLCRHLLVGLSGIILLLFTKVDAEVADTPNSGNEAGPLILRQENVLTITANSPLRKRLVVSPVKEIDSPHTVPLPGVIEADPSYTVNILPPVAGRLTELRVKLGDEVKEGQLLASIHSPDLDQAYADVDKAHDALDFATKAVARARGVHQVGANAVKDIEQTQSNYQQALAESKRAEDRLRILSGSSGVNEARVLNINAPVSGTITALNYGTGSYINDPTAPLMTLSNLDHIWATAHIPESQLASVAKGQEVDVELYAYPGQKFHGTVSFINAFLEPDTHRNKARIALTNSENRLKPNMYGTVHIALPQSKQVVVPPSALLMNNDRVTVFVEVSPWKFTRREVKLGDEDDGYVRILSGLLPGDRVVISGGVLLND